MGYVIMGIVGLVGYIGIVALLGIGLVRILRPTQREDRGGD